MSECVCHFFPTFCKKGWVCILTSLLWSVRQSLHSYEPKWFFIKYGSLLMSMVSKANWRSRSLLSRLLSEVEATPPLPVLPPARCWKSIFAAFSDTPSTQKHSRHSTHSRDPSQVPVEVNSSLLLNVKHFGQTIWYPAWNDPYVKDPLWIICFSVYTLLTQYWLLVQLLVLLI